MKLFAIPALVLASAFAPAIAQTTKPADKPSDAIITQLTKGFKDVTSFATPTSLTGYSAVDPRTGQRITMYYDPVAKVIIYGIAFDLANNKQLGPPIEIKGKVLTAPTAPAAEMPHAEQQKVIDVVTKMAFVEIKGVQADGRVLYAVVEPGCGFCQATYRDLMPLLADSRNPMSKLTIRWVPVSLRPSNFQQVAMALDSSTGSQLERAQSIFVAPAGKAPTGVANRLATANLGAFQSVKFDGTPTFVLVRNGVERVMVGYGGLEEIKKWVE